MLGFQPFVQQAVSTNGEHWKPSENGLEAIVSRATDFSFWGGESEELKGNFSIAASATPPVAALEAIRSGILSEEIYHDISGRCSSANCTWEPYTTLGFCNSVEDVTSTIVTTCGETVVCPGTKCWTTYNCNATTPELNQTDSRQLTKSTNDVVFGVFTSGTLSQGQPFALDQTSYDFNLVNITVLFSTQDKNSNSSDAYRAFKATIRPCMQVVKTRIINGTVSSDTVKVMDDVEWTGRTNGSLGTFWTTVTDEVPNKEAMSPCDLPDSITPCKDTSRFINSATLNYTLDYISLINLAQTLGHYFQGLVSDRHLYGEATLTNSPYLGWTVSGQPVNGREPDEVMLTAIARAVWGSDSNKTDPLKGFRGRMDNLTASMTTM